MFLSVRQCAESMTQLPRLKVKSQFKVIGFNLEFHIRSISPHPVERFSLNFGEMLISVIWCAEPGTQLPRVKVTVQGHGI